MRALRRWRWWLWGLPGVAGVAAVLFLASFAPAYYSTGNVGVKFRPGTLELAHATCPVVARQRCWRLEFMGTAAQMAFSPEVTWRPYRTQGRVVVGSNSARIDVLFLPLWPLIVLPLVVWAPLAWLARKPPEPHECQGCLYDRRGLARGAACPECGAGAVESAPVAAVERAVQTS